MNTLIVIPARGGSKGIPRKNLRSINGHPLLYYSVQTAKKSSYNPDIVISSEDEEILAYAKKFKVCGIRRPEHLSSDDTTLDPVIFSAFKDATKIFNKNYDLIVTLQPTSPLLKAKSLDMAISKMIQSGNDTVISATDDTHLSWKKSAEDYEPNYVERLNRQFLPREYRETGGFIICTKNILQTGKRIGKNVDLHLLAHGEEIDIDTYEDWAICEFLMKRKLIAFVVAGNKNKGLGHVHRALILANCILEHQIVFITDLESKEAHAIFHKNNYNSICTKNILEEIDKLKPHMVINDILDTDKSYIAELKKNNCKVINFEDLGPGAESADAVINALYSKNNTPKNTNIFSGPEYFCLRNEFIYTPRKEVCQKVSNILVTFGGSDPSHYTLLALREITPLLESHDFQLNIVIGPGFQKESDLLSFGKHPRVNIHKDVKEISTLLYQSDIVLCSKGRTSFEVATVGTPAIAIAQNEKEEKHTFASADNGFELILRKEVAEKGVISECLLNLINDFQKRKEMNIRMKRWNFTENKEKVLKIIRKFL